MAKELPRSRIIHVASTVFCDICRLTVFVDQPREDWISLEVKTYDEDAFGERITMRHDICPRCLNLIEEAKLLQLPPNRS